MFTEACFVANLIVTGYLQIVSARVAKVPSTITSSLVEGATITSIDTTNDGILDTTEFKFNKITNLPDGISQGVNDTLVVEVRAVVASRSINKRGAVLKASASFTYTGNATTTITAPENVDVTVVEPSLNITKSATPTTNVEAGDIVQYTITIQHTNVSELVAYTLNVSDSLSPLLALVKGSVKVPENMTVISGNGVNDTTIVVQFATYLKSAAPIVFTYNATVTSLAQIGTNVPNSVAMLFYSAPPSSENVNNRRSYPATASTYVSTPTPTLQFMFSKANPETYPTNTTSGDAISLYCNISLPQGTTRNVTVNVSLPLGMMELVLARVYLLPANVSSTSTSPVFEQDTRINGIDTNNDSIADNVVFKLANLVNIPDADKMGPNDRIILEVVGMVLRVPEGATITTTAQMTYWVDEPFVQTKSLSFNMTGNSLYITKSAAPVVELQAGGIMNYTLEVFHLPNSYGPAYDVFIVDPLPPQLSLIIESVNTTLGTVVNNGNNLTIHVEAYPVNVSIHVFYQAVVTTEASAATHVHNRVNATYHSARPNPYNGNVRHTAMVSAIASFQTKLVEMNYTLNSTSIDSTPGNLVAVGETISMYTVFYIPRGTIYSSILTVSLPLTNQFAVKNCTIIRMPQNMQSSKNFTVGSSGDFSDNNNDFVIDKVVFDMGTLVNTPEGDIDNTFIIEILGVVALRTTNSRGATFSTSARFTYDNTTALFAIAPPAVSFRVVDPGISIDKSINMSSQAESGKVLRIVFSFEPTGNSAAYNVLVTETFPPQLELIQGSVTSTNGNITLGNGANDTTVAVHMVLYNETEPKVTVVFLARFTDATESDTTVYTTTWINYFSSLPSEYNEGNIRQKNASYAEDIDTRRSIGAFSVFNSSIPQTSTYNLAIGEKIVFAFTMTLLHGTTKDIRLELTFSTSPAKMELSYGLISVMPPVFNASSYYEGYTRIGNDTNYDEITDSISLNLGDVIKSPSTNYSSTPLVVLVFAVLPDDPANLNTRTIRVSPKLDYARDSIIDTSYTFTIVGPNLVITSNVTQPEVAMAGDSVIFTVAVSHMAGSTSPAFDLSLSDYFNLEIALWPGTVNMTVGANLCNVTSGNNANDTTLGVFCPTLELATTVVVTFKANLTNLVRPSSFVSNIVNASYAPYPSNGESLRHISTTSYVKVATPTLGFVVATTSLAETLYANVSVGETVSLRATMAVPLGVTPNTSIAITLPTSVQQMGAVAASLYAMPSNINSTEFSIVFSDSNVDGVNDTVIFTFGTLTNLPDLLQGNNLVVEVVGLVLNVAGNTNRKVLTSEVVLTYGNGTHMFILPAVKTNATVVEPVNTITQTAALYNSSRYLCLLIYLRHFYFAISFYYPLS